MSTFTTTQSTVRFTDTDGPVSFTATTGAVTFTAAYQSVTGGGGLSEAETQALIDASIADLQDAASTVTSASSYTMTSTDRHVVSLGTTVTLPDAEPLVGQELTVFAAAGGLTIQPYAGQTIMGQASYSLPNAADAAHLVAVNATSLGIGYSWAVTVKSGPAFDVPDWAGQTQGAILAIDSDPDPAWLPVGTANQLLGVSGAGGALEWKDISEYTIAAANVSYDGTGLFDIASTIGQGVNAAEGTLDRWQFVKAYSTTNVNLSLYVGVGSVATQPTLDDGIAPPEDTYCDVYLFGQTTTSENGLYLVDGATGVWTKYTEPTQFDPGNGHRVNCTENGANFIYLDDGVVSSVARSRRVSDFATAAEASGTGQWYRMPDASATLTTSPGGASNLDGLSDVVITAAASGDILRHNGTNWVDTPGTDHYQAADSELAALATTTSAADQVPYFTGSGTASTTTVTSAARSVLDDTTVAAMRSTLGVPFGVVADRTIGAGGSASESFDVTGLTLVRVIFAGNSERASAQDTLRMTLNADSSSVYSTDSGALTTFWSVGAMPGQLTNADRAGWCEAELHLLSGFVKSGVGRSTNIGSTAAVGQSVVHRGFFSTITAAVTSLELVMAVSEIAAGSRIIVLGA